MIAIVTAFATDLRYALRRYRRWLKSKLPLVRRREYRKLLDRHNEYLDALSAGLHSATDARITILSGGSAGPGPGPGPGPELCLFVTYAPHTTLKPHVIEHVEHLIDAGFSVVLIVNTDIAPESMTIPQCLLPRLTAIYVRENVGFDFAAWAHGWTLCGCPTDLARLLLVNDSIVGPLSDAAFGSMVRLLRESKADVVGLTENKQPRVHLQSFFLALGPRALKSAALQNFFGRMYVLPSKDMVINAYETRMTELLRNAGLSTQALFPALSDDPWSPNDTFHRWAQLIRTGFPYVKASVLAEFQATADVQALVPARFRNQAP